MNKEQRIIILLLRYHFDKKVEKTIKELLSEQIDWMQVFNLSRTHGVAPLLYKSLSELNFKGEVINDLKVGYIRTKYNNEIRYKELDKILKIFYKEKIDVVPLKGMYLAKHVYKDIGLRPMCDIDLFVRKRDINKIFFIFKKEGYKFQKAQMFEINKEYNKHIKVFRDEVDTHIVLFKRNIPIELHTLHYHNVIPFKDKENIWSNYLNQKSRFNLDLIFLSAHLHHHNYSRLLWFFDIWYLIFKKNNFFDWQFIYQMLSKEGLRVPFYYSIKYTEKIFNIKNRLTKVDKISPNYLQKRIFVKTFKPYKSIFNSSNRKESFLKTSITNFLLSQTYVNSWDFSWKSYFKNFILMGRVIDKMRYILDFIFPKKEYFIERYGTKNNIKIFLLCILRPFKLIYDQVSIEFFQFKSNFNKIR